jgi:hypothetical protein
MLNKKSSILRILLVVLGIMAFFFQLPNLIFGTMVKSSSYAEPRWFFYLSELIPHLFTLVVIIWFIVYQIKQMVRNP